MKQSKFMYIILGLGIGLVLLVFALGVSALIASAHTRHHEYPKPCGLVASQEATVSFEGGEDVRICPTVTVAPSGDPEATASATPTVEVTTAPKGDDRSDGLSSCPECIQAPIQPTMIPVMGWK